MNPFDLSQWKEFREYFEKPKIMFYCPEWEKCFEDHCSEYGEHEFSEFDMAFNECCGCIHCVLLRDKVGCGDECHIRKKYSQYQNDEEMFSIAIGFDPEEIMDELEDEYDEEPTMDEVFQEGIRRQYEKEKQLRKAMERQK